MKHVKILTLSVKSLWCVNFGGCTEYTGLCRVIEFMTWFSLAALIKLLSLSQIVSANKRMRSMVIKRRSSDASDDSDKTNTLQVPSLL